MVCFTIEEIKSLTFDLKFVSYTTPIWSVSQIFLFIPLQKGRWKSNLLLFISLYPEWFVFLLSHYVILQVICTFIFFFFFKKIQTSSFEIGDSSPYFYTYPIRKTKIVSENER